MAKVKIPLERILNDSALGYSAMSDKHPRYKKLKKRFKKNALAMDYEADLEKEKKKKKKLKETVKLNEMARLTFSSKENFENWLKNASTIDIKNAGRAHRKYLDYDKALDALIKKDKDGSYIYGAGKHWKKFDFDKGFKALIEKNGKKEHGFYIYLAGKDWKKFDYKTGLKKLKKIDPEDNYKRALKGWPKGIEDVKKITKEIQSKATKLPGKSLRLKEELEGMTDEEMVKDNFIPGEDPIIRLKNFWKHQRITSDNFLDFIDKHSKELEQKSGKSLAEAIKIIGTIATYKGVEFDFDKALDLLIKYDKVGVSIYAAGMEWKKFNHKKGLEALKKTEKVWYEQAIKNWPKGIEYVRMMNKKLATKSKKMPRKPFGLKEELDENEALTKEEYSSMVKNAINNAKEADNRAKAIYVEGVEKGYSKERFTKLVRILGALTVIHDEIVDTRNPGFSLYQSTGSIIDRIFNIESRIIKTEKTWKGFDREEAIKILKADYKGGGSRINLIINQWPLDRKGAEKAGEELAQKSKKLSGKKFKLKEAVETDLSKMDVREIFIAGKKGEEFDYEKGLDELIKKDEYGHNIHQAGVFWKKFDFKKGFEALVKKDKTGEYIYYAGSKWKQFDGVKGLKALDELDNDYFYEKAVKFWPKGIGVTKSITKELAKKSKKLSSKPLKLKEALNEQGLMERHDRVKKKLTKKIRERIPGVKKIEDQSAPDYINLFVFTDNKGKREIFSVGISLDPDYGNENSIAVAEISGGNLNNVVLHYTKRSEEIKTLLAPNIKDVERMTKEIESKATKLKGKKLKLKEAVYDDNVLFAADQAVRDAEDAKNNFDNMRRREFNEDDFDFLMAAYYNLEDAILEIENELEHSEIDLDKEDEEIKYELERAKDEVENSISELFELLSTAHKTIKNFNSDAALSYVRGGDEKIFEPMWILTAKDAKKAGEELAAKSKKMPKKKFKLKESVEREKEINDIDKEVEAISKKGGGFDIKDFERLAIIYKKIGRYTDKDDYYNVKIDNLQYDIENIMNDADTIIGFSTLEAKRILKKHNFPYWTAEQITKDWVVSKEDAREEGERLAKVSKKLHGKKYKLKEAVESPKGVLAIASAAVETGITLINKFPSDEDLTYDKIEYNYEEFKKLVDTYFLLNKISVRVDKIIERLAPEQKINKLTPLYNKAVDMYEALENLIGKMCELFDVVGRAKGFDREKALLLFNENPTLRKRLAKRWPPGVKGSKEAGEELAKKSKKMPSKPLRLKEEIESKNIDNEIEKFFNSAKIFYKKGITNGYSKKLIRNLIEIYEKVVNIYYRLDVKTTRKTEFNVSSIEVMISTVETKWKDFDKDEALEIAKDIVKSDEEGAQEFYNSLWPPGIKSSIKAGKELAVKSTKLPSKPLKLKEALNEAEIKKFDSEEQFDKWLKKANYSTILNKGMLNIPGFNYDKAFEKLLKAKGLDFQYAIKAFVQRQRTSYEGLYSWTKLDKEKHKSKFLEKIYSGNIPASLIGNTRVYEAIKDVDYDKLQDSLQKAIANHYSPITEINTMITAANNWGKFSFEKAVKFLKTIQSKYPDYPENEARVKRVISSFPIGIKEIEAITKEIENKSKKLPGKPLRLKEAVEGKMSWEEYEKHVNQRDGNINALMYNPFFVGKVDSSMFLKMAEKILNEPDKEVDKFGTKYSKHKSVGSSIQLAGSMASKKDIPFDFKKALDLLFKSGAYNSVIDSGYEFKKTELVPGWKEFNHKKALDYLEKHSREWYLLALQNWSVNIERAGKITKEIESKSKKLPGKKFKLKEAVELNEMAKRQFTSKEDFEEWLEKSNAKSISIVGRIPREYFDYKKAFAELEKKDKGFSWDKKLTQLNVRDALQKWPQFTTKERMELVYKHDKHGETIVEVAKARPKTFDYEGAFEELVKRNKSGKRIASAGVGTSNTYSWPKFPYEKAFEILKEKGGPPLEMAMKMWPKDIKFVKNITKEIESKSKKLPGKKYKLKEAMEDYDFSTFKKEELLEIARNFVKEDKIFVFSNLARLIRRDNKPLWKEIKDDFLKIGIDNNLEHRILNDIDPIKASKLFSEKLAKTSKKFDTKKLSMRNVRK